MADIGIRGIRKTYSEGKAPAVSDVDLTVADGEFMVLLGPSGCGKTTLLRLIAGLEQPDAGFLTIGDKDVTNLPPRRREIAMVFQNYAIFPHMRVADNISFGLRMRKAPKQEIKTRVQRAAELVELADFLDRYPSQLSGGQRQRVAVGRAIATNPAVLLMDEPLSNLDALLRLQFRASLKKLVSDLKATTIYVTHDQIEALSLGDRIAVMRDGVIVQCDTPMRVYDEPATTFVGSFIGNPPMNFLTGLVQQVDGHVEVRLHELRLDAPDGLKGRDGGTVGIGIRAENIDVCLEEVPQSLCAQIEVVEPLGADVLLTANLHGEPLKLLTRPDFPVSRGQTVFLTLQAGKVRWFDSKGSKIPAEISTDVPVNA